MPIDYEWKNIICSYFVLEGKKSRLGKKSHNLKVCTPPLEEKNTGIKKSITVKVRIVNIVLFLLEHLQNVSKICV